VVKITILSIVIGVLWLGPEGGAQEMKSAPATKAPPGAALQAKAAGDRKIGATEAKPEQTTAAPGRAAAIRRDPFRPLTLAAPTNVRRRENLSPLERYEIGQLKLVGIIWDIKTPTALIEDTSGLGYTVRVGTPIGVNDGKVKAIRRSELVVEEFQVGADGARKSREVLIKLSAN
jgi:type IV pilus assembly protein PilP